MDGPLENIGPAVLNGGISTFLAFVILALSKTYVFQTFFKMFAMVVTFGLFNGLIFLPVLLSLIGPSSVYDKHMNTNENSDSDASRENSSENSSNQRNLEKTRF